MTVTLDSMRADIARAIGDDPEAVGMDDNLMDLGLDSMRAMTLVVGWSETGLDLDFSALAETPTLRGWWAHAQSRGAGA